MPLRYLKDGGSTGITQIVPDEPFIDPVSKIRVSQPENLIDTDFEYGLQETKWETLERVNNIPTFFARPGERPLKLTSADATAGGSRVTVKTSEEHGLVVGSPIIAQGLNSFAAEGGFVVDDVISGTEFSYVAKEVITQPGALEGSIFSILKPETSIVIGRLYQGTQYKLDALDSLVTDGGDPSRLTVNTASPHGFSEGTKFILSNSVGGKTFKFDASQTIADEFSETTSGAVTAHSSPLESFSFSDWDGEYRAEFTSKDVDFTNNTINVPNHPFSNGDALMYIPPVNVLNSSGTNHNDTVTDAPIGGVTPYNALYYAVVIDNNKISLASNEFFPDISANPSIVNLTNSGTTNTSLHQIAKAYRITAATTGGVITLNRPLTEPNPIDGQECYVFSTSTGIQPTAQIRSFRNYIAQEQLPQQYFKFYLKQDVSAANANLPTSPDYGLLRVRAININTSTNVFTIDTGVDSSLAQGSTASKLRVTTSTLSNFETGDEIFVFKRKGATLPGGVAVRTPYWIRVLSSETFSLHTNRANAINNAGIVNVTSLGASDTELLIEKQNKRIRLFTDPSLQNQRSITATSVTGTTWIVLGKTNTTSSTLIDTLESGIFNDFNNGDVVSLDLVEKADGVVAPENSEVPLNTFVSSYSFPRFNFNVALDNYLISNTAGDNTARHNGSEVKYTVTPAFCYVNARQINLGTGVWTTSDGFPFWLRGFSTGDKVTWRQSPRALRFNAAVADVSGNRLTALENHAQISNGDRVVLRSGGDLVTLPEGLTKDQTYFVRNTGSGLFSLYATKADSLSDLNRVNIQGVGMGLGYFDHFENAPTGLPSPEDDIFIRVISTTTFSLHTSSEGAINNTNTITYADQIRGTFIRFEQVLTGQEGLWYAKQDFVEFEQTSISFDTSTSVITTPTPHPFETGEEVHYLAEFPVGGLTDANGSFRFVRKLSSTTFTLHNTRANAISNAGVSVLSGTPQGLCKIQSRYGKDFTFAAGQIDTGANVLTFEYNHPFETGDNVRYLTRAGSITGLTTNLQYFVRKLNDTQIALYLTAAQAAADTSRINITGLAAGYGTFTKIVQLPINSTAFFRRNNNSSFYIYENRQDSIIDRNRIQIARRPGHDRAGVPNFTIGSGQAVFTLVKNWARVVSVNNASTNLWNVEDIRNLQTGQQVFVRGRFSSIFNNAVQKDFPYYIRRISNTIFAFHKSYNGAMRDIVSDRVNIFNTANVGTWYIESTPIVSGIGSNVNLIIEKPSANHVRFVEDSFAGRTIKMLPTVGSRFSEIRVTKRTSLSNSNTVFIQEHGLRENVELIYNSGPNAVIPSSPELENNSVYYVSSPTENRFRLSESPEVQIKELTLGAGSVDRAGFLFSDNFLGLTRTVVQNATNVRVANNDIQTTDPHTFQTGDEVVYFAPKDLVIIGGLVDKKRYYVIRVDSTRFALALTPNGAATNTRVNITATGSGTGFFSRDNYALGDSVTISLSSQIAGLVSGSLYYVGPVTPTTFALFYTREEAFAMVDNNVGTPPADLRAPMLSFTPQTVVTFRKKDYLDILDAGVGIQELNNVGQNAVDGIYTIEDSGGGSGSTQFTLSPTNAVLSPRSLTFNPYKGLSTEYNAIRFENHKLYAGAEIVYNQNVKIGFLQDDTVINDETNVFTIEDHGLSTGQRVVYESTGSGTVDGLTELTSYFVRVISDDEFSLHPTKSEAESDENIVSITLVDEEDPEYLELGFAEFTVISNLDPVPGLENGNSYFVIRKSKDWISLATTKENAINGEILLLGDDSLDENFTLGSKENHGFTTFNVGAEVLGPGTVSTTLSSNSVSGSGTNFFNLFKNGDLFKIFVNQDDEDLVVSQTNTAANRQRTFTQNTTNISTSTGLFNIQNPAHNYLTGNMVRYDAATPAAGLTSGTNYFVRLANNVNTDTATAFFLHETKEDAIAGTNTIIPSNAGSGTATFTQADQIFAINHGYSVGQTVSYSTSVPESLIGDLEEEILYYVAPSKTLRQVSFTSVNTTSNIITTVVPHNFITGDVVTFSGSTPPEGLVDGTDYFIRVLTTTTLTLHSEKSEAINGTNIINLNTAGSGTRLFDQFDRSNTFFIYDSYQKAVDANGTFGSDQIALTTGTGEATITSKFTGSVFESRVSGVRSETGIVLSNSIPEIDSDGRTPVGTQTGLQYALVTSLFVKSDGFALHRPFDGGVELTPSLNPDASLVRQTRKYFRYQSGKGIQVSYGINFNAPKDIDSYTVNTTTGIAKIKTRFPNRVTTSIQIKIDDAIDGLLGAPRTFLEDPQTVVEEGNLISLGSQQSLATGQKVIYTSTGANLGRELVGLESGQEYWVSNEGNNDYFIYSNFEDSIAGDPELRLEISIPQDTEGQVFLGTLTPVNVLNGTFPVTSILDDDEFEIQINGIPASSFAEGFPKFVPAAWSGSLLRCGVFDDQNGLFFEFDGQQLYAVRRSSVEQISGTARATFNSSIITGQGTLFVSQLDIGDSVVIRGQAYKVVHISSNTSMSIQPAYRGVTLDGIVITKTVDTKVPQSEWNLDKADGTGRSKFNLDLTKMQMAYIDYSWYGAGKARFGFKSVRGDVQYFHEFVHNNLFTEAYMRSGNLPGRYEVFNLANPTFSPTIAHWGTSIIMDGKFDDDDAYLFTAPGETISYTNTAEQQSFLGRITQTTPIFSTTIDGQFVPVFFVNALSFNDVRNIRPGTDITGASLQTGTKTLLQPQQIGGGRARVYVDKQPTATTTTDTAYNYGPLADPIPRVFPLVSVRLGPTVDNSLTGPLGVREIINRMQLDLQNVGLLTTHDVEIKLILNGNTDNLEFVPVSPPSLAQLVLHKKNDTISGGVEIYTFNISGASNATASIANSVAVDLSNIAELGNSIQGGDGIFPDGPDLLTIAATVVDTSLITSSTPFRIAGRVTWSESQA